MHDEKSSNYGKDKTRGRLNTDYIKFEGYKRELQSCQSELYSIFLEKSDNLYTASNEEKFLLCSGIEDLSRRINWQNLGKISLLRTFNT